MALVVHRGEAVAVGVSPVGEPRGGVDAAEILGMSPGAIDVAEIERTEQIDAALEMIGAAGKHIRVTVRAEAGLDLRG